MFVISSKIIHYKGYNIVKEKTDKGYTIYRIANVKELEYNTFRTLQEVKNYINILIG